MLDVTEDVLKAILALTRSNPPAWVRFTDWLSESLQDQSSKAINEKDEVKLRWSQGGQGVMHELLQIFHDIEKRLGDKRKKPDEWNPTLVFD